MASGKSTAPTAAQLSMLYGQPGPTQGNGWGPNTLTVNPNLYNGVPQAAEASKAAGAKIKAAANPIGALSGLSPASQVDSTALGAALDAQGITGQPPQAAASAPVAPSLSDQITNFLLGYGQQMGQAAAGYTQAQWNNAIANAKEGLDFNTAQAPKGYQGLAAGTGAIGQQMADAWNGANAADALNAKTNSSTLTDSANSMEGNLANVAKALGLGSDLQTAANPLQFATQNAVGSIANSAQNFESAANSNAANSKSSEADLSQAFGDAANLAGVNARQNETTALNQLAQQATQAVTAARYQFMPSASELGNVMMTSPLNQAESQYYNAFGGEKAAQSNYYNARADQASALAASTSPELTLLKAMLPSAISSLASTQNAGGTLTGSLSGGQTASSSQMNNLLALIGAIGGGNSGLSSTDLTAAFGG